ncbi:MAG: RDD family protein [Cocleimonas sp.]
MNSQTTPASLGKRFLAIIYDLLIAFFFSLIITLIIQNILIGAGLVTLEAVKISESETIATIPADSIVNIILTSFWLLIPFLYFGYNWTKQGQTLGMKVWKIKAVSNDKNKPISWTQSVLRFFGALFGLGFLWIIIDKEQLPLQDRLSKTRIIRQP